MSVIEMAGKSVEVDGEGFMVDHTLWSEDIARELAKTVGIDELNDKHFQVLNFMRKEFREKGTGPSLRKLKNESGVNTKELYALFPKGPAKKAALIAGITKPQGCI
jgi:dissimilatory sulfite reductase related protein